MNPLRTALATTSVAVIGLVLPGSVSAAPVLAQTKSPTTLYRVSGLVAQRPYAPASPDQLAPPIVGSQSPVFSLPSAVVQPATPAPAIVVPGILPPVYEASTVTAYTGGREHDEAVVGVVLVLLGSGLLAAGRRRRQRLS